MRPGESITIHVSTNPPSPFVLEIYRLGYYQGHGGALKMKLGPFKGTVQPDPPVGPKRLRECAWEPSTTIKVPDDWTSGVYLGQADGRAREAAKLRHLRRPRRPQG